MYNVLCRQFKFEAQIVLLMIAKNKWSQTINVSQPIKFKQKLSFVVHNFQA